MRRAHPRETARTNLAVLLVLAGGLCFLIDPPPLAAEGPQPAKKDSNQRFKPKDATLTTAVEPAQARPGDTVTFKVAAKLQPGWHIYPYAAPDAQQTLGPVKTTFDLF